MPRSTWSRVPIHLLSGYIVRDDRGLPASTATTQHTGRTRPRDSTVGGSRTQVIASPLLLSLLSNGPTRYTPSHRGIALLRAAWAPRQALHTRGTLAVQVRKHCPSLKAARPAIMKGPGSACRIEVVVVAAEARQMAREDIAAQLQELVLESVDVAHFLDVLAEFSCAFLSAPDNEVRCAFTVLRRKKAATVASSDDRARELDEIQLKFGEGPCLAAMEDMSTVHVTDVATESRW